jgi:protein-S-isoprenylcysteine O-methyltransferase
MEPADSLKPDMGPEDTLRRRGQQQANSLETVPVAVTRSHTSKIPNTPLAASTISFVLGFLFLLGLLVFLKEDFRFSVITGQIGFFLAAWSAFHWGEFAVTAGWNREKCSVDCACSWSNPYSLLIDRKQLSFWRTEHITIWHIALRF